MLIIIEGPEKRGKTTLAKGLAKRYKLRYVHHGPPTNGADGYIDELLSIKRPTVMDRSFIGEMVYGPMYRGQPCFNREQLYTMLRVCQRLNTLVIFASNPQALAVLNDDKIGDTEVTEELDKKAWNRFMDAIQQVHGFLPVVHFTASTHEEGKAWALDHHHQLADATTPRSKLLTGIGSPEATLVLVGEKNNCNVTWRGLPFDAGQSSSYLNQVLNASVIPHYCVYLLNSENPDGSRPKVEELELLLHNNKNIKFVALGRKAGDWLSSIHVKHYRLEHPQFRRRFKTHKTGEYIQQLEDIYHA